MRKLVPVIALLACSSSTNEGSEIRRYAAPLPPVVTAVERIAPKGVGPSRLHVEALADGALMVQHGGETLRLRPELALPTGSVVKGALLERARGPLVELVAERPDGVEVSWRFAERPSDSRDARVTLALEGARVFARSSDGVLVRRGDTFFRLSEGMWVDAAGHQTKVPIEVVDGAVVYAVPQDVVKTSSYPAVLDPTISAETEIEGPVDVVAPGSATATPRFDGTNFEVNGGVVLAARVGRSRRTHFSTTGARVGGIVTLPSLGGASVLLGATESLVLSTGTDGLSLGFRRVDAAWAYLDTAVTPIGALGSSGAFAAAFDGSQYVVVWDDGTSSRLDHVSSSGLLTHVASLGLERLSYSSPSLTCTSGTCLLVDGGLGTARRLGSIGALGVPFALSTLGESLRAVGTNGGAFELLSTNYSTDYQLRTLSAAGVLGAPTTIAAAGASAYVSFASGPSGHLVVWESQPRFGFPVPLNLARLDGSAATKWSGTFVDDVGSYSEAPGVSLVGDVAMITWLTNQVQKAHAMVFDSSIKPSAPPTAIDVWRGSPGQYNSAMASDGTNHLVAWLEERDGELQVRARRIDGTGKPLEAASLLLTTLPPSPFGQGIADLAVGWDGARYHVAWRRPITDLRRPLERVRVAADGTLIDASPLVLDAGGYTASAAAIAGHSARSVIAWSDAGNVYVRRFDDKGEPLGATPTKIALTIHAGGGGDQNSLDVACDAKRCLVTFAVDAGASTDLAGAFVDDAGAVSPTIPLVTTAGEQSFPAVSWSGSAYLVAWTEVRPATKTELRATRFGPDGKALDAAPVVLADGIADFTAPDVVWDGRAFVVGARRSTSDPDMREIVLARVRADGVAVAEPPWSITTAAMNTYSTRRVTLSSDGKGTTFVAHARVVDAEPYVGARLRLHAFVAAQPSGGACKAPTDCDSGFCVDGVCCSSPCSGPCEACDVAGAFGTCTPVGGRPHGARSCTGGAGDACTSGACDGKDATKCANFALEIGGVCGAPSCTGTSFTGAATCSDGRVCTTPAVVECAPYRCAPGGCLKTCANDGDCVSRASCLTGSCVPSTSGARCSDDKLSSIGADGVVTSCAPLRCNTDGTCFKSCSSSDECVPGFICDTATAACLPADTSSSGSSGCATGPNESSSWGSLGACIVLAVGAVLRRRRRQALRSLSALAVIGLVALVGCRSNVAEPAPRPAAGTTTSALVVGAESTTVDTADTVGPGLGSRVACATSGCLVVSSPSVNLDIPWLAGHRLDASGAYVPASGFVIANIGDVGYGGAAVGSNGTDYLVVWNQFFASPLAQRVSGSGALVGTPIPLVERSSFATGPTVGWDGSHWLVTWSEGRSGKTEVVGARLATDGSLVDTDGFTIVGGSAAKPIMGQIWQGCDAGGCTVLAGADRSTSVARIVDGKVSAPVELSFKLGSAARVGSSIAILGRDASVPSSPPAAIQISPTGTLLGPVVALPTGVVAGPVAGVGFDLLVTDGTQLQRLDSSYALVESLTFTGPVVYVAPNAVPFAGRMLVPASFTGGPFGSDEGLYVADKSPLRWTRVPVEHRAAPHVLPRVASNGTQSLVAFLRQGPTGDQIVFAKSGGGVLTPTSGTVIASEGATVYDLDVRWDGTNFVVAWVTAARVAFARIDPSGSSLDPGGIRLLGRGTGSSWYGGVRLGHGTDGAVAVLVPLNDCTTTCTALPPGTIRLKGSAALDAAPQPFTVSSYFTTSLDRAPSARRFAVGSHAGSSIVVWGTDTLRAIRLGPDGKAIGGEVALTTPSFSYPSRASIVDDGAGYTLVFGDSRKGSLGSDIFAIHVAYDLSGTPDEWLVSARDANQLDASIAVDGGRAVVTWTERTPTSDELRASLVDLSKKKVLVDAVKLDGFGSGEIVDENLASWTAGKAELVYERADRDPTILASRVKARTFSFDSLGGATCTKDADCELGPCIDGVCCNTKCDGTCEACDVPGSVGTCKTIAGKPHGARACATGTTCAEATCDGFEPKSCAKFAHAFETKCAEPKCDGAIFSSPSYCDGKGGCSAPTTASCAPFACDSNGCLTTCTSDASCAKSFTCKDHTCVAAENGAVCVNDGLGSKGVDGAVKDCSPYRCDVKGTCAQSCDSAAQCAPGFACDPSGQCVAAASGSSGGCVVGSVSTTTTETAAYALAFVAALGLARTRRRRG